MIMRNDLYSLVNELNNMFYDGGYKSFPIDVVEVKNGFEVEAEMPGMTEDNIKITFEDGDLTIEATPNVVKDRKYVVHERNTMKLRRTISFGDIDEDKISAKFENGVLIVSVTVKQPQTKPAKTIAIE